MILDEDGSPEPRPMTPEEANAIQQEAIAKMQALIQQEMDDASLVGGTSVHCALLIVNPPWTVDIMYALDAQFGDTDPRTPEWRDP